MNKLKTLKKREYNNTYIDIYDNIYEFKDSKEDETDLYNIDLFKNLNEKESTFMTLYYSKKWSASLIAKEYKITEMNVYYILRKARHKIEKRAKDLGYI